MKLSKLWEKKPEKQLLIEDEKKKKKPKRKIETAAETAARDKAQRDFEAAALTKDWQRKKDLETKNKK